MPIFLLKSLLSIPLLALVLFSMITMLELFGRTERRFDTEKLRRLHAVGGYLYFLLFAIISYFCLEAITRTGTELSARAVIHSLLAVTVIILLPIKSSFVRAYRQFYSQAKTIGFVVAVLSLLMIASSAGHYFLASDNKTVESAVRPNKVLDHATSKWLIRTDPESIRRGRKIYDEKCIICHDPLSNNTIVGPGHKGIMKNPLLPISNKPATAENIAGQLRHPFGKMPSFDYLSDDDIRDLLAYMSTL